MSEKELKTLRVRRFCLRLFIGVLVLLVCGLSILWWRLQPFFEYILADEASEVGFHEPTVVIEQIELSSKSSSITGLRLSDDKTDLTLAKLAVTYDLDEILDGVVEELELFDLRLALDMQAWVDELAEPSLSDETIEEQIRLFLEQPAFRYLQLHDANITVNYGDSQGRARVAARLSAGSSAISLDLNGSIGKAPVAVQTNLVTDGNVTSLSSHFSFANLVALKKAISAWSLPYELDEFSLYGGFAEIEGEAEILGDTLVSPFFDVNAGDLSLAALGQTLRIPHFLMSASETGDGTWRIDANGTTEANATGIAENWTVEAFVDSNACEASLSVDRFQTFAPLPTMTLSNLTLPSWRISYADPTRLPLGESKTFGFDDFSFIEGDFVFNLYEGEITVAFLESGETFAVQVAPTDAVLPEQGVVFRNFSYTGVVEPFREPYLSFPQSLSGESIIIGEESLVSNVALSFHLLDMNKVVVDSLALTFDGSAYELNPAKITIEQFENGSVSIDLNTSIFSIPDLLVRVEGISGGIALSTIDPLSTSGFQELRFDSIYYGGRDEVLVSDVALSFHLLEPSKVLVDSFSFTLDDSVHELKPAKVTIEQFENGSVSIDLNASKFGIPDLPLSIEGVKSVITLSSLDPLVSEGPQELRFDAIRYGELALLDVRFLFSLEVNGTFALHEGNASLFGGEVVFEPTRFRLEDKEKKLAIRLRDVDGSEVVALLNKFDGEVEGKFSGLIPLSNRDGAWDYVGGYLELNPGAPGRLRYRSDGILTSDVQPGSAEFKRLRQVELALKDLDVKRLRLDFLMEDGQRRILGDVQGKSQIDKKTFISLDYRPKILAGFDELLQLNSKALGVD
ncbi:MAG: hypothetical protein HN494_00225 [Opitutae bacterium]|nr:hypothetical protein [Opitutae bacterium]